MPGEQLDPYAILQTLGLLDADEVTPLDNAMEKAGGMIKEMLRQSSCLSISFIYKHTAMQRKQLAFRRCGRNGRDESDSWVRGAPCRGQGY
jgi:hypothetical protein